MEGALGVGSGVRGRGGLAPIVKGPGNPGGVKNTHHLFFFFVLSKADGIMEEPALQWLPQVQNSPVQLPRPFVLSPLRKLLLPVSESLPGGPGEEKTPMPSLPSLLFQNHIQCFLVGDPGR